MGVSWDWGGAWFGLLLYGIPLGSVSYVILSALILGDEL